MQRVTSHLDFPAYAKRLAAAASGNRRQPDIYALNSPNAASTHYQSCVPAMEYVRDIPDGVEAN